MDFKKRIQSLKWLIIFGLASYRLADLIATDDGPLFIFANLRDWTDKKAKAEQNAGIKRGKWQSLNDGIHCPFCVGIWAASLLVVVYTGIYRFIFTVFIYAMAIAGVQSWLQSESK